MTKIHTLPDHVINKIAAGEVVERPASVVKELVENSIDAEANHIIINLRSGGKSLIEVIDNGTGIASDDIPQAFLRHATSKITAIDDLESLLSLGFRGEALASIAAVSTVYIESATDKNGPAHTMTINHGKILDQGKASRVPGTTLRIEHLFAKIPARKKFLKSDRQELAVITKLIQELGLSYPHIHFELHHDGKTIINTTPKNNLLERFYDIFSKATYAQMFALENEESGIQIAGVISSPLLKRATRTQQMICINGRVIRDYRLSKVIEDAYHGFLLSSEHPVFFLHITLPPSEIDINVHPRKTEIRFAYPEQVMSALYKTVKSFLAEQILAVPVNKFNQGQPAFVPRLAESPSPYQSFTPGPGKNTGENIMTTEIEHLFTEIQVPVRNNPIKVLSQIKNSYILCEAETSLLLFDQHAAHERFIYEKLKAAADNKTTQPLLNPITLQVTPEQNVLLTEFYQLYKNFGFTLEQHSPNTWLITEVPVSKKELDYENIVLATLEQTNKASFEQTLTAQRDDILHTMACKAAVKFNDRLSIPELQNLIDNVAYLPGIYTCPHGRPFRLELKFNDLNSYFKRI